MLRKTRSRVGPSFTEVERMECDTSTENKGFSLRNGKIGVPYRRVKVCVSSKSNLKKEEKLIDSPDASCNSVLDIKSNIKVISNNGHNNKNEYFSNKFKHSKSSLLEDHVLTETNLQYNKVADENHFTKNGIQHPIYGTIEESRTNVMLISELKVEICLALYCFFSLIYLSLKVSTEKSPSFSSIEEALFYKITWCLIFGCFVDLFSWKIAFQIQALLWLSLLISNYLESSFIWNILSKVCISSSASLVTEVAIFKLYKREKCWLPICRLNLMNSLCLICVQFFLKDIFIFSRKTLYEYIQKNVFNAQSLGFLNYPALLTYQVVDLPSVMIMGCTLSLLTAAYLSNEKNKHLSDIALTDSEKIGSGNSSENKKFNSYIKILMLKASIFLPAICFSSIFNNYLEKWRPTVMPAHFIALCVLSIIGQYLSVTRILPVLCLIMILSFSILYLSHYLYIWASISTSALSLLFSVVVCLIRPSFQYVTSLEVNENFTGFSLSSLISLHFLMKYFAPNLIDIFKSNNEFLNSFKLF